MTRNVDIKKMAKNGWNFDRNDWDRTDLCVYLNTAGQICEYEYADLDDCDFIAEFDLDSYDAEGAAFSCKEEFEQYAHNAAITLVQDFDYDGWNTSRLMEDRDIYRELPTREDLINELLEDEIDEDEQEDFLAEVEENGLAETILNHGLHGYAFILYGCVSQKDVEYTEKYNMDIYKAVDILFEDCDNSNFFSYVIENDSNIKKTFKKVIKESESFDDTDKRDIIEVIEDIA